MQMKFVRAPAMTEVWVSDTTTTHTRTCRKMVCASAPLQANVVHIDIILQNQRKQTISH